jgi:GNAT superfamily N-acetyltransferase
MDHVRVLLPTDVEQASQIFGRAFDDDPVWRFFCNDDATRSSRLALFFGFLARSSLGHGWLHATSQLESLCLWTPPTVDMVTDDQVPELLALVPEIAPGREELLYDFFGRVTQAHPHEPHWYLGLFATDTPHRGRGLGMGLLERDLSLIDETKMPCYLESSNPANEPRYRAVGFEVVGSFDVCHGGPPMVQMWRPSRQEST